MANGETGDQGTSSPGTSDRGTADRGTLQAEEASRLNMLDHAGVRSIVQSGPHRGRLVFDPARRWTPTSRIPMTTGEILSVERIAADEAPPAKVRSRTGKEFRVRPRRGQKRPEPPPQLIEKEPEPGIRPGFSPRRTYKESTFEKLKTLRELIQRESGEDPVLARAIAGAYADEFNTRSYVDELQDSVIALKNEAAFKLDRMQVNLEDLAFDRPGFGTKQENLFTNDIGPANIRLGTAVLLVELNRLQFEGLDPRAPFRSIAQQLSTDSGTIKAAAAWLVLGKEQFRALGVLDRVPKFEQEALLVSWFKEGPIFLKRFSERRLGTNDPQAIPRPNEGGEAYLQNRKRILHALEE